MSFWIVSAFILFAPVVILQHLHLLNLPKGVDITIGVFFVLSSSLLVTRGLRLLYEKFHFRNKAKGEGSLLIKLEAALDDKCLTPHICFDKNKCIEWANNIEVLLKGVSAQYDEWAVHRTAMIQTHDMFDGMEHIMCRMKNVLDLAIKEITVDIKQK